MDYDGLKIYFCGEDKGEPGDVKGPAIKPHYILYVVLSGKGIFQRGTEFYHLEPGDVFLSYPEELIYLEADEYDPWQLGWVAFAGSKVRKYLPKTRLSKKPVAHIDKNFERYCIDVKDLIYSFQTEVASPISLAGKFLCLVDPLLKEKKTKVEDSKEHYVDLAKEYMRNNYSYDVRIHEVAAHIGIDRSYLYRLFMEKEGVSPKQYLVQYRLEMARAMLESGKYRFREITYSCGFSDGVSFETYFVEQEGISPEEYLWKYRKKAQ